MPPMTLELVDCLLAEVGSVPLPCLPVTTLVAAAFRQGETLSDGMG